LYSLSAPLNISREQTKISTILGVGNQFLPKLFFSSQRSDTTLVFKANGIGKRKGNNTSERKGKKI